MVTGRMGTTDDDDIELKPNDEWNEDSSDFYELRNLNKSI